MSESPDETSLWREILGRNEFDDRIDTQSDITNLDAFRILKHLQLNSCLYLNKPVSFINENLNLF